MQPNQIAQHALAQYARAYANTMSYEQARTAHNASSAGVLHIEAAWDAMLKEDAALKLSGATSIEALTRSEDVARFEQMQRDQGLSKVFGVDGVAQWVPKAEAERMALAAFYAPKFAALHRDDVKGRQALEREVSDRTVAIGG